MKDCCNKRHSGDQLGLNPAAHAVSPQCQLLPQAPSPPQHPGPALLSPWDPSKARVVTAPCPHRLGPYSQERRAFLPHTELRLGHVPITELPPPPPPLGGSGDRPRYFIGAVGLLLGLRRGPSPSGTIVMAEKRHERGGQGVRRPERPNPHLP